MKLPNSIEIQLKIVSFLRTSGNVQSAVEFCYLILEIGLENLEVKMGFRISARDVKGKQEKENEVGCT